MALGYSTLDRLNRILRSDPIFTESDKVQALQFAASAYGFYDGDGSETTYIDQAELTLLQSELIATVAAIDLVGLQIGFYQNDAISTTSGPVTVQMRSDKLAWLQALLDLLMKRKISLEGTTGFSSDDGLTGLLLSKVRACSDPIDDTCSNDSEFGVGRG